MTRPTLATLVPEEIEKIKAASLEILERTGVNIDHIEAREVLQAAGAKVEGERVYFPPKLVMEAIAKAPRQFTIHARNPSKNITVGAGDPVLAPGYGAPYVTLASGLRRKATFVDFIKFAKLSGSSANMGISGGVLVEPSDVAEKDRHNAMLYACIVNSDKPFMGSATGEKHAKDTLRMAGILFDGEKGILKQPVMISLINTITPLMLDERMVGALIAYAEAGQPVIIASLGMAGATSPATLASALALQNAEILAGITLAQTIREGTPVVYGSASSITEMRNGSLSIGAPEGAWIIATAVQIAHSYGLPCRAGGCLTDSKILDLQASYESMMSLQAAGMAGVDFVLHAAGILESYMSMSMEKFIMDDELCSMVRRFLRGTKLDVDDLAVQLIHDVGPGGQFLTSDHTYQNFRTEFWQPTLSNRETYDQWRLNDSLPMINQAEKRVNEIVDNYEIPYLDKSIERKLKEMAGI
ncbi:trimethylamine methyltransferase family protein [Desulfosporosinus sp. BICA1-9]|uniref:trimethylamine methyltransferase family protein n=1 Tax=Desulfosporosinus sp. BICA1-9 TaxID=1531958 RepID=UPI00054B62C7|nr:trimethylamine methyltransferase family protein [Desulfosporosinus sp. BICA1-9]KJS50356.1 MAG: trimethylamine methyltransferase [Peptococcaceae bacterium BRH_c23]KJS88194.1 MAG: trimethylamine methyltransferase [Desulfosporosinus sp. BICA1-9]HBW36222.1 trimethylamine--corrinoid methyltransferase [Desulfosporosinus sp.]